MLICHCGVILLSVNGMWQCPQGCAGNVRDLRTTAAHNHAKGKQ